MYYYSKYQSFVVDTEYSLMFCIGALLPKHYLFIDLRLALAQYRLKLLDRSIALSQARVDALINNINTFRNS